MSTRKKGLIAATIIAIVVLLDQILKIWVKTSFYLYEEFEITSWFQLVFVENEGMAFGMTLGSKLFLTLFRIAVVIFLSVYIVKVCRIPKVPAGYVVCLALIIAGASGNIFDSVFYGRIFNDPLPPQTATLFPVAGGYAPLFFGKVVDMFYFPLFSFVWPSWMPWVGGDTFIFFKPVFNLADAAISVGIVMLFVGYHRYILTPAGIRRLTGDDTTQNSGI